MKPVTTVLLTAGAIAVSVFAIVASAGPNEPASRSASPLVAEAAKIEHGRYIVHRLGLCIDCHSPRDEKGEHLPEKHLQGSPLPMAPTVPMPFVAVAPRIAGLPAGYSEADLVHFLMTGERPHGLPPPLPPMPPYRMNREDAEATAAYIRTLPTGL
jgi:mono/diheme cytochrome c family protein